MTPWSRQGSIFQTTSDTEVLLHLYARSKAPTVEQALIESVTQAQGAFSLVLLTKDRLIAVRDPHGFRPLTLGRLGDAYVGLLGDVRARSHRRAVGARHRAGRDARDRARRRCRRCTRFPRRQSAHCVFEHVYFARPDSYVFGQSVNEVRTEFGRRLAREQPAVADVVVPDSGLRASARPLDSPTSLACLCRWD